MWISAAETINQPAPSALNAIQPSPPRNPHPSKKKEKAIQSCLVSSFVFISTSGRFQTRPNTPTTSTNSPQAHPDPPPQTNAKHY